MDLDEIRAETERLVAVANDRLVAGIQRSQRRILKAEWEEEPRLYMLELECGHNSVVSEPHLRSPVLCLTCIKERLL